MNPYEIEIFVKQRQKELDEEFKRIHLLRAARKPGAGHFKKVFFGLGNTLFAIGTHLNKRVCPIFKPLTRGHKCEN